MKKTNVKIQNVEPEFQASVGERKEEVTPGTCVVLTRAEDPQDDGGWKDKRVIVLGMDNREQPYLTTENHFKGSYVSFAKGLENAPAFLKDAKGQPVKDGETGTFNSEEIHVGLANGNLIMQSAK